jgi:ribosomal protein S18 acetylase RimI-like enzyme
VSNHIIRKGIKEDSEKIADIFLMAGGDAIRWVLGEKCEIMLKSATKLETSPFSYNVTYVFNMDGKFAGAVVAYPFEMEKKLNDGVDKLWSKYLNIFGLISLGFRIRKWEKNFEKPKNSYYFHAVAVFPQYRGLGIATKLLEHVEEIAKNNGQSSLALEVMSDNKHARKLYEKYGFKTISKVPVASLSRVFMKDDRIVFLMKKDI